jgi:hypothetical protein
MSFTHWGSSLVMLLCVPLDPRDFFDEPTYTAGTVNNRTGLSERNPSKPWQIPALASSAL